MDDSFARTAMLIGWDGVQALAERHVAVFGLGGVGSWAAEALARAGIGTLTLVDNDVVSTTNINRQLPALTDTVGRRKTDVVRERLLKINPAADIRAQALFFGPDTAGEFESFKGG